MKKQLSSDAQYFLETLSEDSIIEPDDWHFTLSSGGKRFSATPQLKRHIIRDALVELNEYKPNFLSVNIKKEYNLIRIADETDLKPTEMELKRLEEKLIALSKDHYIKYDLDHLKNDPKHKIRNSIISALMIDISDVIAFLNGELVENLYHRINERRRKFDSP